MDYLIHGANKGLILGSEVESIGDEAFCGQSQLTGELNIPENVKSIGKKAFFACNGLTTIKIPNNVITIGENAFERVDKIKIVNNSSAEGYPWGAE